MPCKFPLESEHSGRSCAASCNKIENRKTGQSLITFRVIESSVDERNVTKGMVNNIEDLCLNCEPQTGNSIGVWGSMKHQDIQHSDIFKSSELYFNRDSWAFYSDGHNINYYWQRNADYAFSFYYPSAPLRQAGLTVGDSRVSIPINTEALQEDIMLSHIDVSTHNGNPVDAVGVQMHHCMSAIRVAFEFYGYDDSDKLTSCWFENHKEPGFSTSAVLDYNNGGLNYSKSVSPALNQPFYKWTCTDGIPFSREGDIVRKAYAYSQSEDCVQGQAFTENDAYLMVLPQELSGDGTLSNTLICFTTAKHGSNVMRVKMPQNMASTSGRSSKLLAGHRYTVNIKIGQSSINQGLTFEAVAQEDIINDIVFE